MNGRVYDPATAQFYSPDPQLQSPGNWLNYNRYGYCYGNPFKYTDPSGEFLFVPILIAAVIFGTGNLVAHAIRGDVKSFGDGLKYFGQGALAGAVLGAAWQFAPALLGHGLGGAIQTGMTYYAYGQAGIGIVGTLAGAFNGGWKGVGNGAKAFLGNFYLDENSFLGGVGQGISRHSWEFLQTTIGHGLTQIRNATGNVDRVDYLGGATFATHENVVSSIKPYGITFGSYINMSDPGEIGDSFEGHVLSTPAYMHEYGHYIDSQRFGLAYLPSVGLCSAWSAEFSSKEIITEYNHEFVSNLNSYKAHDILWTEMRANRNANKYFKKYYNLNSWPEAKFPLTNPFRK